MLITGTHDATHTQYIQYKYFRLEVLPAHVSVTARLTNSLNRYALHAINKYFIQS